MHGVHWWRPEITEFSRPLSKGYIAFEEDLKTCQIVTPEKNLILISVIFLSFLFLVATGIYCLHSAKLRSETFISGENLRFLS